jgi:phosphate transport system substrate-binding protein
MVNRTPARSRLALAVAIACLIFHFTATPALSASVVLDETGSTLLLPLFKLWIPDYMAANPDVKITTAGTGSGAGIEAAISGSAQIGASDAYMSDEQAEANPHIVNIPLAIAAQTINYNLPELNGTPLKLDGPTLAGIYSGTIREWDASPIQALNPEVKLPHQKIIPIRRADASGDTFVFTQFLDFSTPSWDSRVGYGTTVDWPSVPDEKTAVGNQGMLQSIAATPYSIGYIGISFASEIDKAKLGTAMVENQSGRFLLATPETITAAASQLDSRTPADERLSLAYAPGDDSYPLINYEYVVVSTRQPSPEVAKALRDFLLWANTPVGGNTPKYLDTVHFVPLPDFVRALSEKQIDRVE